MERPEEILSAESISDFIVEMMTDEEGGEEFTQEYLEAKFLSSIGRSLYYARRKAGLTQEQVAERMNTQQPAIARLEADKNGSMSFRRYVDFAKACGMMPRSLVLNPILEPIKSLRDEVIARAKSQAVQEDYNSGLRMRFEPEPISYSFLMQSYINPSGISATASASVLTSNQESTPTANSAERFVKEQSNRVSVQSLGESITNTTLASQTSNSAQVATSHGQGVAA